MTIEVNVSHAPKPRNYQPLPPMYFVAMDDWIEKLGEKSFCLWLKLYTMVDRTDENRENHCIKTRTSKLIKRLDMSKPTYLKLIKPLYEYGLVELEEYEESVNLGSKPVNIKVYDYPRNEFIRSTMELEKCRSWEKRTEEKYSFTKDGGRPKKEKEENKGSEEVPTVALPEPEPEVIPEPAPLPEPTPEPIPVPESTPVLKSESKSVPKFNDEVDLIVMTEYQHFKEAMTENQVNLSAVVKWINNNAALIGRNEMCYVLNQLATYPEPIKKTPVFITNAMKHADNTYTPVTLREQPAPLFG